jgi:hypothetical protein
MAGGSASRVATPPPHKDDSDESVKQWTTAGLSSSRTDAATTNPHSPWNHATPRPQGPKRAKSNKRKQQA